MPKNRGYIIYLAFNAVQIALLLKIEVKTLHIIHCFSALLSYFSFQTTIKMYFQTFLFLYAAYINEDFLSHHISSKIFARFHIRIPFGVLMKISFGILAFIKRKTTHLGKLFKLKIY